jgi:hypothetical protein
MILLSIWSPKTGPRSYRLTAASDEMIPIRYDSVVTVWREALQDKANGLVETTVKTSRLEGNAIHWFELDTRFLS